MVVLPNSTSPPSIFEYSTHYTYTCLLVNTGRSAHNTLEFRPTFHASLLVPSVVSDERPSGISL